MSKKKPVKALTLSKDKKFLGVAGGIAEYFDINTVWVRIIALMFIVLTGIIPGLIIYFIIGSAITPKKKNSK